MKIAEVITKINNWVANVVMWVVIVSTITIVFEVVMRYFFHSPTRWCTELNNYLLCGYVMLGGGYVLSVGGHVKVDVFYNGLSARKKAIIDVVTSVLFFAFVGVLLWQSAAMAMRSIEMGSRSSESMQWPLWPVQSAIALGALFMLLQGIAKLLRDINTIRGRS